VPTSVLSSTIKAVTAVAAGQAAAGVVSLNVAALTEGVLKAMLLTKLKCAMMVLLVAAAVVGSGGVLYRTQAADPGQPGLQPELPRTVAEQNPPVERKPEQDKNQESKKPKEKAEGATPKAGTAKGEADEPDKPAKPTADRVKQVRQMYAKLPSDILGVMEPTKRIVAMNKSGRELNIILEDANDKKLTIHLLHGPLVSMGSPLLLTSGRLPPRGPEESAVYGLLLRLAANPPEKTMPELLQAVDAILAVLDERFAGAMPITSNGAKK
jgi:hypothetical protein